MVDIGDGIRAEPGAWTFGGGVARNFDTHVARSVPFYNETHRLIEQLSDEFLSQGARVYDLGCSTGLLTERLAARHSDQGVEVIGVDREPEMVAIARRRCGAWPSVTILESDLADLELQSAELVVAHYTLQFIAPDLRRGVVTQIAHALAPGGAVLLFEKVRSADARVDELTTARYHDWKRGQGFSDAEIAAKALSLEGVLEPFTSAMNVDMLTRAGFDSVLPLFRWLNWEGLLAVR